MRAPAQPPAPAAVPAAPKPAPAPVAAASAAAEPRRRLVVLRGSNAGSSFRLSAGSVGAGRAKGLLLFPDDPFLAPLHATFFAKDGKLFVRDEGAASGIFVRIKAPERLADGALFAAGDHLVRWAGAIAAGEPATPPRYGAPAAAQLFALEEILQGMRAARACARPGPVFSVGRSGCDLNFPNDALIAQRHCEIALDHGLATLRDLNGSDGTYLRLPAGSERELQPGDSIRLGMQLLKLEAE